MVPGGPAHLDFPFADVEEVETQCFEKSYSHTHLLPQKGVTHPKGTWIYNKKVKHISKYFKEKGSTHLDS